ncbi:MAG TPA: DUF4097 family beta strand repeat-containing protein [Chthoniobacterales bacterium]
MKLSQGAVEVQTADISGVTIHVSRQMTSLRGDPKRALAEQKIDVTTSSNELRIQTRRDSSPLPRLQLGDVTDFYQITVPRKFSVDIDSGVGGIRVGSIEGDVSIRSAADGVAVERVDGNAELVCSGGDIYVQEVTGPLKARAAGGTISVGSALAGVEAKSSGGDIEVIYAGNPSVIKTAGGDISIASAGGALEAKTAGGDIDVEFKESPKGDCDLSTAGGNIRVVLPTDVVANIDAKSSGGEVKTDFGQVVTNKAASSSFQSNIHGGGHALRLRSSGGDIALTTFKTSK